MNSLRIENNAKVTVTAKLWKIRQGVQISADYVGTPAEGYQVGAVRTVPDTISVAGSTEGLESLADIELLTTNGIEVGRFIREEQENMETAIVYISANSSYAMDLFRVQPTDFLIKPLDKIKVGNVMNRIQKISEVRKGIFEYFGNGYYFKVLYKDILYFSSQNKKVHLVLKDGQKEFNGKLKEIAKKIPGNFIQIHQSYLINFDYIEECSYESVKMKNGDTIPISQPYRKSVRKQLAERVWRDRE